MKLTLTRNLGRADAKRIGIEKLEEAQRGKAVNIKDEKTLNEFRSRGLVVETSAEGTSAAVVDFDAMTKEDLKAYADANQVEGVTASMTKDDMVRTLKKFNRVRG